MKRLFLAIGLAAFLMTSCCCDQQNNGNKENAKCDGNCKDKKEQCCGEKHQCKEMTPEMKAEIQGVVNAFKNWAELDDAQKTEAIAMGKALVDKCEAKKAEMAAKHEGCNHEGKCGEKHEGKCGEKHEGCNHEGKCGEKHEGKCGEKHEGCNHEGKCGEKHEGCNHEGMRPEGCPEAPKCEGMKMTKEECAEKWANFANLPLDEQKAVLCCKLHHCPGFMMVAHEMMPKPEGCCDKHEGEKHECTGNHEGCKHECK